MSKSNTSDCLTLRKARWMPALTVSRNSTAVMAEPIERMASYERGGGREERERERDTGGMDIKWPWVWQIM